VLPLQEAGWICTIHPKIPVKHIIFVLDTAIIVYVDALDVNPSHLIAPYQVPDLILVHIRVTAR